MPTPCHAPRPRDHGRRLRILPPAALAAALLFAASAGCYRRITYASPEGRHVEVVNLGFDTKIGSLSAETPQGTLRIENADSQAVLAQRVAELAAVLAAEGGR